MKSAKYIAKLFKGFTVVSETFKQSGNFAHYTFVLVHDVHPWNDPTSNGVAECRYEIFIPLVEVTGRSECRREWRQAEELVTALHALPHME